jgi:NAD-dependent aldehyde dehydrogenases
VQEPRPFLIGGLWRHGETVVPVNNPFTGRLLAEVSNAGSADAEDAIQSTVDALSQWELCRPMPAIMRCKRSRAGSMTDGGICPPDDG